MGARGPRPVPSAILEARGSWRANKNKAEPTPPPGVPECPDYLGEEVKQAWKQTAAILEKMGVLSLADGACLERYCVMLCQWKQCQVFLAKHGLVYPIKSGTGTTKSLAPFPQLGIAARLSVAMTRIEGELGLTPSARSRIQVDAGTGVNEDSPWLQELLAPFDHLLKN